MNNYTITLSSNATSHIEVLDTVILNDHTTVVINVQSVYEGILPAYMKIDWGDGKIISVDNDIPLNDRTKVNLFVTSSLLNDSYTHEYYPSSTSLYKQLSAQVLITYPNSEYAWFIIPISIRTYDYFESIYDLSLTHTNILPIENNSKQHILLSSKDRFTLHLMD